MKKYLLLLGIAIMSLSACSVTGYIPIKYEVLRPAYYTLPSGIDSVLVVSCQMNDNFKDETLKYVAEKTDKEKQKTFMERIPAMVCATVMNGMEKSGYISAKMELHPMSLSSLETAVDSLCERHGVDAVLYMSDIEYDCGISTIDIIDEYACDAVISSVLKTKFSMYMPNGVKFSLEQRRDTIQWACSGNINPSGGIFLKMPNYKEIYYYTAQSVGENVVDQICPGWDIVDRKVLMSNNSLMIDATRWVKQNEWDNARDIWFQMYGRNKVQNKILSAINLSIYYEREDDVENAAKWSSEALDLIEANGIEKYMSEKELAETIFNNMMKRKQELKELSKQM